MDNKPIPDLNIMHRVGDYGVVRVSDLPEKFVLCAKEGSYAVVLLKDNNIVDVIGWDGGEPEDQLLVRDWSWIPAALNDAYKLGKLSVKIYVTFDYRE